MIPAVLMTSVFAKNTLLETRMMKLKVDATNFRKYRKYPKKRKNL